jgi:hypothetical protein
MAIDLTGQRYGRLTVIREVERNGYTRRWLCRCDCGNERIVTMPNLRNGHTTSCGCVQRERTSVANTEDLTGQTFGRLHVLGRAETKPSNVNKAFWACLCECGNHIIVASDKLKSGDTRSCGCLRVGAGQSVQEYNESNLRVNGVMTPALKRKVRSDSSTGVKGVSRRVDKNGKESYVATITIKGRTYYLGRFKTLEEAAQARKAGEKKYHQPYLEELRNGQRDSQEVD